MVMVVMMITSCTSGPSSGTDIGDQHTFRTLAENALWVAHPDYGFYPSPTVKVDNGTLTTSSTAYPIGAVMARDIDSLPITVSYKTHSGDLRISPFPKTRLGRILEEFGSFGGRADVAKGAQKLLAGMGRSVEVTIIAELTEPMAESEIWGTGSDLPEPQRALLSYGQGEKPLGNSIYCVRTCDAQSYVASFQEWVSTLRSQDDSLLKAFGLTLKSLQSAAQEGKIYGLIYESYDAKSVLAISRHPKIKAVYAADVNLRCDSDLAAVCQPMT
jgi:hypothetical protein